MVLSHIASVKVNVHLQQLPGNISPRSSGKVFSRLFRSRQNESICPKVISESQCGFRPGSGTMDMILSASHLLEKCLKQRVSLCKVFVDLSKVFDSVNREALLVVRAKFGCTPFFMDKLRQLHHSMKAGFVYKGKLSEEI